MSSSCYDSCTPTILSVIRVLPPLFLICLFYISLCTLTPYVHNVMGASLWSASPLSKPSTQMTISSLFDIVPIRLKPLTRLLSLIGYLGVVSWSMGKAGGGSHDGLRSHGVKGMPVTYI